MSKIKVSELFYSLQGEGKYIGVPSVFLRTFGCNFRCPSFGLHHGEKTTEVAPIIQNLSKYKSYNELPLVSTGCDSYAAVYPEFKDLSPMRDSNSIVEDIMSLLPHKEWREEHLIITGGEPLLGWQRAYEDLLSHPKMNKLKEITFETNGTQPLQKSFKDFLLAWQQPALGCKKDHEITFSVSAKLPCSGEAWNDAIKPEIVCEYEKVGTAYLKFVIATEQDFADAKQAIVEYRAAGFTGYVYLMPVGGTVDSFALNNKRVAELALNNGLRYSDRLQVSLYKNAWGT
jgi:7-carboxy-7-deazaguanine synthase